MHKAYIVIGAYKTSKKWTNKYDEVTMFVC